MRQSRAARRAANWLRQFEASAGALAGAASPRACGAARRSRASSGEPASTDSTEKRISAQPAIARPVNRSPRQDRPEERRANTLSRPEDQRRLGRRRVALGDDLQSEGDAARDQPGVQQRREASLVVGADGFLEDRRGDRGRARSRSGTPTKASVNGRGPAPRNIGVKAIA